MNLTLSVPDISCGHCKASIEGAFDGMAGVEAATVSIEERTVSVDFDDTVTPAEIVVVIEDQGYVVA